MVDFKVGDRVYVPPFTRYDKPEWAARDMAILSGHEYTIKNIANGYAAFEEVGWVWALGLGGIGWVWRLSWLEPVIELDFEPDEDDGLACLLGIQ